MDVHEPKLPSCWYFWPPSTTKATLPTWQHDIVWPNYRTKWQENAIGPKSGHILSEMKPFYRGYGLDRYIHWENGFAVEKVRRIWKFWFYLSLCENIMGCKHKLNNQHIQSRSLVHTLAGLNENMRLSIQFQELLHITWCWRLSQHRKMHGKSTKPRRNDPASGTQLAEEAHRLPQYCHGIEISKVV